MTGSLKLIVKSRAVEAGGYKAQDDALDIFITDLEFHAQKPNNPKSLVENYAKHLRGGKPKRTFGGVRVLENGRIEVSLDFDEAQVLDILAKSDKSKLRIYMPTQKLPTKMSEDALEKIESLKRKHLSQVRSRAK